jgi:carbon-monoxide dehydrogenase large subunit
LAIGPNGDKVPLSQLAGAGLSAEGTFATPKRTYSYGTHAAHVTVDAKTGDVKVLDYVAVEDVGRIINPETLHGQCLGAVAQGIGGTLYEQFDYDENGQPLSGSFADYLIPTAAEIPHVHVVTFEMKPSPVNPLGAKGAGEGGIIPVGGVLSNAVAAALSSLKVEPHELPLSPQKVWQMMRSAEGCA